MSEEQKRGRGRPRLITDDIWKQIEGALFVHATEQEVSDMVGCTIDTIDNECKRRTGLNFLEYSASRRSTGKVSLRRLQFQSASRGNAGMLIWLGKHWLNQWDKVEQRVTLSEDDERAIDEIKEQLKKSLRDEGLNDGGSNT